MVDESIEWDIDANLPMYTRDYLKLMKLEEEKESFRADSQAVCSVCSKTWYDHLPSLLNIPTLRQTCDGRLVKL